MRVSRRALFCAGGLVATIATMVGCEALLDVGSLRERAPDAGGVDSGLADATRPVDASMFPDAFVPDAPQPSDGAGSVDSSVDAEGGGRDVVVQVAAGPGVSCALTMSGRVYCWGSNQYGALGDGTASNHSQATEIAQDINGQPFTGVTEISIGGDFVCARKGDGSIWCWGAGDLGQLGDGHTSTDGGIYIVRSPKKVQVTGASVLAGAFHTCLPNGSGAFVCFGSNYGGELGHAPGSQGDTQAPYLLGTIAANGTPLNGPSIQGETQASMGWFFGCARKMDTSVWCWGSNDYKALGVLDAGSTPTPIQVHGASDQGFLTNIASVSARGLEHACAVDNSNQVWCWGGADEGQLGPGVAPTFQARSLPVNIPISVSAVAVAGYTSCAIDQSGRILCWGANDLGQLGHDPASTQSPADTPSCPITNKPCNNNPRYIDDVLKGFFAPVSAIAVGGDHGCALKTDGTVWCWGSDAVGQLGDGNGGPDAGEQFYPVQVVGLP
jgi:alpha-tubulin suppressor-like RCC1 family protein